MIGRNRAQGKFEATHIDMVPMVDCIMVLLIFLMISSAFVEDPGIEVQKPDVSGSISNETSALIIAISADNRVFFDGQELRIDQIAATVKQAAFGRTSALIIRADKDASHGIFSSVYSEAKRAGIQHVQFATARGDLP
jgi:biopolymer transport protein ExbD